MLSTRRALAPVGSANWIAKERQDCFSRESTCVDDFLLSARNDLVWLNEYMYDVFSGASKGENEQINIFELLKTPGRLRGKTPKRYANRIEKNRKSDTANTYTNPLKCHSNLSQVSNAPISLSPISPALFSDIETSQKDMNIILSKINDKASKDLLRDSGIYTSTVTEDIGDTKNSSPIGIVQSNYEQFEHENLSMDASSHHIRHSPQPDPVAIVVHNVAQSTTYVENLDEIQIDDVLSANEHKSTNIPSSTHSKSSTKSPALPLTPPNGIFAKPSAASGASSVHRSPLEKPAQHISTSVISTFSNESVKRESTSTNDLKSDVSSLGINENIENHTAAPDQSSDTSSPPPPIVRSSLNFAALPARETLNVRKSSGVSRVSRTHVSQTFVRPPLGAAQIVDIFTISDAETKASDDTSQVCGNEDKRISEHEVDMLHNPTPLKECLDKSPSQQSDVHETSLEIAKRDYTVEPNHRDNRTLTNPVFIIDDQASNENSEDEDDWIPARTQNPYNFGTVSPLDNKSKNSSGKLGETGAIIIPSSPTKIPLSLIRKPYDISHGALRPTLVTSKTPLKSSSPYKSPFDSALNAVKTHQASLFSKAKQMLFSKNRADMMPGNHYRDSIQASSDTNVAFLDQESRNKSLFHNPTLSANHTLGPSAPLSHPESDEPAFKPASTSKAPLHNAASHTQEYSLDHLKNGNRNGKPTSEGIAQAYSSLGKGELTTPNVYTQLQEPSSGAIDAVTDSSSSDSEEYSDRPQPSKLPKPTPTSSRLQNPFKRASLVQKSLLDKAQPHFKPPNGIDPLSRSIINTGSIRLGTASLREMDQRKFGPSTTALGNNNATDIPQHNIAKDLETGTAHTIERAPSTVLKASKSGFALSSAARAQKKELGEKEKRKQEIERRRQENVKREEERKRMQSNRNRKALEKALEDDHKTQSRPLGYAKAPVPTTKPIIRTNTVSTVKKTIEHSVMSDRASTADIKRLPKRALEIEDEQYKPSSKGANLKEQTHVDLPLALNEETSDNKRRKTTEILGDKELTIQPLPYISSINTTTVSTVKPGIFSQVSTPVATNLQRQLTKAHIQHQSHTYSQSLHVPAQSSAAQMPPVDVVKFSQENIKFAATPLGKQGNQNGYKASPTFPDGETIELPDIQTDSEDESDGGGFNVPIWAESPELRAALRKQLSVDPEAVFGPMPTLSMDDIFRGRGDRSHARFRNRTSSANWGGTDRLTPAEIEADRLERIKMIENNGWTYK